MRARGRTILQGVGALCCGAALGLGALCAQAQSSAQGTGAAPGPPLSSIDWLGQLPAAQIAPPPEAPVARTGRSPAVTVAPLGAPPDTRAGLVPSARTGLSEGLWQSMDGAEISRRLGALAIPRIAEARAVLYALLLAEADPPRGDATAFQVARVDALIALGALDPARELLRAIGERRHPAYFERFFNLSILLGDADEACRAVAQAPYLLASKSGAVFCAARRGQWDTAALLYGAYDALGQLSAVESALLARFLDPELVADHPPVPLPDELDPILFVLFEAAGQRPATRALPPQFAHADLDGRAGWRKQLEAAERLALTGAMQASQLEGLYTERAAAASGGLWDRVRAVQALDRALEGRSDPGSALAGLWTAARGAGLGDIYAQIYAGRLANRPVADPAAAQAAFEMLLLSPDPSRAVALYPEQAARAPVAAAIARADTPVDPDGLAELRAFEREILAGLLADAPRTDAGAAGAVLLAALDHLEMSAAGDANAVRRALVALRSVGFATSARRAALQLLVMWSGE